LIGVSAFLLFFSVEMALSAFIGSQEEPAKRRMKMGQILTKEAQQGYNAHPDTRNPFLFTSLSSDAWELGKELRAAGAPEPNKVSTR
jgi:hypothetical protein